MDHLSEPGDNWGQLGNMGNCQSLNGLQASEAKLGASVLGRQTPTMSKLKKGNENADLGSSMPIQYEEEDHHNLSPMNPHREHSSKCSHPKIKEIQKADANDIESITSQKKSQQSFVKNASYSFKITPVKKQEQENDEKDRHSQAAVPNL